MKRKKNIEQQQVLSVLVFEQKNNFSNGLSDAFY